MTLKYYIKNSNIRFLKTKILRNRTKSNETGITPTLSTFLHLNYKSDINLLWKITLIFAALGKV